MNKEINSALVKGTPEYAEVRKNMLSFTDIIMKGNEEDIEKAQKYLIMKEGRVQCVKCKDWTMNPKKNEKGNTVCIYCLGD